MVHQLDDHHRLEIRRLAGCRVVADDAASPCPVCGGPMRVRKTFEHGGMTLAHGPFEVRETVFVCAAGCTRLGPDGQGRRAVIQRQAQVAELLLPRSTVGYDVMTFVGLRRFVDCRQRAEIQAALEQNGLTLSSGEVSDLAGRFLVYLEALHQARAPDLRKALERDGGWPLHIDATGEDGQGTLFVTYAGWRRWALGAWKIPTERADAILPKLRTVEARFGAPCAIMRDLGKAVTEAAGDFVGQRKIPILSCHLHFAKDVGKDLLRDAHDELRGLFRRFDVLPGLRTLARDLGRGLGTDIERARRAVAAWLTGADERFLMPAGPDGLAVVRALAQWVLSYADDGTDAGFPFDRPYLDLYRRCLRVCRAAESLLWKAWDDPRVHKSLERLHALVEPVRSELPFQRPARTLETRGRLFDELRAALRLKPKPGANAAAITGAKGQLDEIRDVERALKAFRTSLEQRRPERGPAENLRKAIDLVIDHLDRHGPSLSGHVISLPRNVGGGIRLVERTNVLLENFWHEIKHGERRRSGRKNLAQDFEHLPAAAALARNLTRPDYVAILCGTLDDLPRAFADLDASDRSRSLPARLRAKASASDGEIVSSSLPKADRDLVRMDAMRDRVLAEAASRAPRRLPRRRRRQATVV
jgi:hypothetical protein